jgi:16S rRNA (adenine1518-N6/adenine1519-N6)-dimethyltransferase
MVSLKEIKTLCHQYSIQPLRRRGQNFLINQGIIDKIIKAADLNKQDTILEIGAGLGTLTKEIAKKVKKVIAVEIDRELVKILNQELNSFKNIKILATDIRQFDPREYNLKNYKVVANLPFNVTGLVLKKFLSFSQKPDLMVLILQKEVGERIIAQPPQMSRLSVMVQFYGQPQIIAQVKKNNFWPCPQVDSVILKIDLNKKQVKNISSDFIEKFFNLVKAGFSSPRKYLINNLIKHRLLDKTTGQKIFLKTNLNFKIRAQELSVVQWIDLAKKI